MLPTPTQGAVMTNRRLALSIISTLSLAALSGACGNGISIAPVNNDPVITSVHAFPSLVAPSDSFAVVCSAYEPDGDPLYYDWSSTAGKVQGSSDLSPLYLPHTTQNVRVFYAPDLPGAPEAVRVDVTVRDGKGNSAGAYLLVGLSR